MAAVRNENWPALRVRPSGIYWVGDTISILFSGGLLCLGWGGCGPQEQHLVQETVGAVGVRGHNTSEHPFTSSRRPESEVLFQGQTQACLSQTCPAVQHFQMLKTKELFHPLLHFSHVAPSFSSLFCKANENFHKFKARNFHTWACEDYDTGWKRTWERAAQVSSRWVYLCEGSVHGADLSVHQVG